MSIVKGTAAAVLVVEELGLAKAGMALD